MVGMEDHCKTLLQSVVCWGGLAMARGQEVEGTRGVRVPRISLSWYLYRVSTHQSSTE